MAHIPFNIAEAKGKVDFGIISIREDEYDAVLKKLTVEQILVGRQRYAMSRLKTVSDDEYVVASVRSLEPGTGQAQDVARTMIDELDPQWILLVGIAGSIPDYEYTLGDVILASRLHDFSVSAMIEGGGGDTHQEFASGGGPMHPDVQSLIANLPALNLFLDEWFLPSAISAPRPVVRFGTDNFYGNDAWRKKVRDCLRSYFGKHSKRDHPKALAASVASSGILLKDTQTASVWLTTSRDIKGIEMELAGVYQAAWGYHKPVLAIRGISDVVGFRRSPEWTNYACHTAAAFTLALLQSRPIVPLESKAVSQPVPSTLRPANQQVGVFKERPPNPGPLAKQETLYSNLLKVSGLPETIHAASTDCKDAKAVWAILNKNADDPPSDWIIRAKTIYSFHNFSAPIWGEVCDASSAESHKTSHWANSQEADRVNEFIDLLTNCLKQLGKTKDLQFIGKAWVSKTKKQFRYMCYRPTSQYVGDVTFRREDFIDADALVISLKGGGTPLGQWLFSKFPRETQELIKRYPASASSNLRTALVNGFNDILKNELYDDRLFADLIIRRDARRLIESDSLDNAARQLLNRMLLEDAYWRIIVRRALAPRRIVITSLVREAPTYVFKAYRSSSGQLMYYRHHAFRPHFLRIDKTWFLEITPTYHYTSNGYRVAPYYEDLIKGIKRRERSGAVFRQVMFWARVLQNKESLLHQEVYPHLKFGDLLEFEMDYAVPEQLWVRNRGPRTRTRGTSQLLFSR